MSKTLAEAAADFLTEWRKMIAVMRRVWRLDAFEEWAERRLDGDGSGEALPPIEDIVCVECGVRLDEHDPYVHHDTVAFRVSRYKPSRVERCIRCGSKVAQCGHPQYDFEGYRCYCGENDPTARCCLDPNS